MEEENKDIKLLRRLDYEIEKQKKRVLQMVEIDCKRIGMKIVADYMGFHKSYIYKVVKGEDPISVEKTIQLFYKVKEIIGVLKIDERDNRKASGNTDSSDINV